MKYILFFITFTLISCASKITTIKEDTINKDTSGLIVSFKLPPELISSTCVAHFRTDKDKTMFLEGIDLSNKLTIMSLSEGIYSFNNFECSNIWGTRSKLVVDVPYLKNLKVINSMLSITIPVLITGSNDQFSIQQDLESADSFYLNLATILSKSDNAISAYNAKRIPLTAFKNPSQNIINVFASKKYSKEVDRIAKNILVCKGEEFDRNFLLIGSASLKLPSPLKKSFKDRGYNSYSDEYHACVNEVVQNSTLPPDEPLEIKY